MSLCSFHFSKKELLRPKNNDQIILPAQGIKKVDRIDFHDSLNG